MVSSTQTRILITGGSGFIGTNLIDHFLSRGINILNIDQNHPRNVDHKGVWKQIDILQLGDLESTIQNFNPTHIIHLAARTDLAEKNNIEGYSANIQGLKNLLKIAEDCKILKRIIFTSSMLVCASGYDPKTYDDYCPPNLYGQSKVLGEKMIKDLNPSKYEWTIVRPTSIWGPWFGSPYQDFFQRIQKGAYFKIQGQSATKTFGYVGNTVHQLDQLLFMDRTLIDKKTFYLGDDPPLNINVWADMIANQLNRKIKSIPLIALRGVGVVGDCLQILYIKFPVTSFRVKNMTTNNIISLLKDTAEVIPDKPYTTEQGIALTLRWMNRNS